MKNLRYCILGVGFLVSLAGCSGGSGGGGGVGNISFEKWSTIAPPATIDLAGISQDVIYTPDLYDVKDVDNAFVTIEFDADGVIQQIDFVSQNVAASFNLDEDIINNSTEWIYAVNTDSVVSVTSNPGHEDSNPLSITGWEYQTFGVWSALRDLVVSGSFGGMSIGAPTPLSDIPLDDSAPTFVGRTSGIFVDAEGTDYFTYGTLQVAVNFATRNTIFTAENTLRIPMSALLTGEPDGALSVADDRLNWGGNFFYDIGTNSFTGPINTNLDLDMNGSTTFQFYGPNAEELGGVFYLTNDPNNPTMHYSGAYGADQQPPLE